MKQKITYCAISFLLLSLAMACDEGGRDEGISDTSESDSTQDTFPDISSESTSESDTDSEAESETETGTSSDMETDTGDAGLDSGTEDAGADSGTGDTDTDTDTDRSPEISSFQGLTHFLLRGLVVTPSSAPEGPRTLKTVPVKLKIHYGWGRGDRDRLALGANFDYSQQSGPGVLEMIHLHRIGRY